MTFFSDQQRALTLSRWLVFFYLVAVGAIVLLVYLAVVLFLSLIGVVHAGPLLAPTVIEYWWHPRLFTYCLAITSFIIASGALYKSYLLSKGGRHIAEGLGGRLISGASEEYNERKIYNVVEEMALASGMPVPSVYLLEAEDSINAFAAGLRPSDAVIGVTRGSIEYLTRDELQGVVAHEFSHILNGDMRLNVRLMGLLHGILLISHSGQVITYGRAYSSAGENIKKKRVGRTSASILGILLICVGSIGVMMSRIMKGAVLRQREYLADASAVQFTRYPAGIGGALKKIGGFKRGSFINHTGAEEASHLLFANGLKKPWFDLTATHPPLIERIKRIDPEFNGIFPEPDEIKPLEGKKQAEPATSGQEPATSAFPEILALIGAPLAGHLLEARRVLASIPTDIREKTHHPYDSRLVVLALLLSNEKSRLEQLTLLQELLDEKEYKAFLPLSEKISALDDRQRLSLLELSFPSLRELSSSQLLTLKNAASSIFSSGNESFLQFLIMRIFNSQLTSDPKSGHSDKAKSLLSFSEAAACLLASVALAGGSEPEETRTAFLKGLETLGQKSSKISLAHPPSYEELDTALSKLSEATMPQREVLLKALLAVALFDRSLTLKEAELLRAVGLSLEIPIPLLL